MPDKGLEKLEALRHSAAHLLAAAVLELWPEAKLTLGPATQDGFYYDFDLGKVTISMKDLPKIAKRMKKILQTWKEFTRREASLEAVRDLFKDNPYKLELIEEIAARGEPITLYKAGNFEDLCRGGHVEAPSKELLHFELLAVAGAYWRGDESRPMLTRIYGTAFPTAEGLIVHLNMLEEAKKRDHRKLGQQLDLFTFSPLVGPGLPLFTPRGTVIRDQLSDFLWQLQSARGYQKVDIPHLARPALYQTSGHWDKFGDNLFHVRGRGNEAFVMKPMNCPHHTQLYACRSRSYRDLPLRLAEITKVYRDEQAGELLGLARVRSITQDDAHIFCRSDQIEDEISSVLDIVQDFYAPFGFALEVRLALSDAKNPDEYLGTRDVWQRAEESLRSALRDRGMAFLAEEGEAAFYGPKIDFTAIDSLKRRWQLATVQLDFNMPECFGLVYTNAQGDQQTPVMIHRAITGAQERFMAILLEHYAGHLPLWLSPTQAAVLPMADDQKEYAEDVAAQLRAAGIRVDIDGRSVSLGKKIREAELMKVPIMLVIGKKEVDNKTVAVRSHPTSPRQLAGLRGASQQAITSVSELTQQLAQQIAGRA